MKRAKVVLVVTAAVLAGAAWGALAQSSSESPQFTKANELIRPMNFREWIFLTSGLGMTYNQGGTEVGATPSQNFTNVYVTPAAYRSFMRTGHWPDKTMFVLEVRASATEGSINKVAGFRPISRASKWKCGTKSGFRKRSGAILGSPS